jgi:hypothetical protein
VKVGDLVVSKAYQNYAHIVPAKLVVQVINKSNMTHIVLEDSPDHWKPAKNFFVVSRA